MLLSPRFPRFPRLAAFLASPRLRRPLRALAWTGVGLYFALGLLVLALRHAVLPAVGDYRADIERKLGEALGQPVAIHAIEGRWRALWPSLSIHGLEIRDAEGRPALGFDEVEADLAWASLWHFAPIFARLEIKTPRLDLRRDPDGRLFVAGLEIKSNQTAGPGFSDWLLAQDRIVIREATVTWHDELRQAPPLALSHLNFDLRNRGSRHRFGLTAEPPRELATRLDLRGDFHGDDLAQIDTWSGQAYAELDYADLAVWRTWVDYPVELPHGSGGVRLWLDLEERSLAGLTVDLRLARTAVRLAPDLPMLDLDRIDGRIAVKNDERGYLLKTRRLALATRDGIAIEPTDVDLRWQPAANGQGGQGGQGEARANQLDLGALAALAAHLPFDATVREKLAAFGPRGRLQGLELAWVGPFDALTAYRFKTRFDNLSLNAQGTIPGFFGLDGVIEASQRGGEVRLDSRAATVELPAVFEEQAVVLASLDAVADWVVRDGGVEVRLQQANFRNADAEGFASGRWRGNGKGAGEIDLAAKLTRADGGSVWRYMPLVVGQDVRHWLRESLSGGVASATLRLKGDLDRFPFKDGSGIFEVKGPLQGVGLRYAEGWPAIDDVTGDLLFSGSRMLIRARTAALYGVQLADVKAEIADLGADNPMLVVTGNAHGPTTDFLRFIDQSPVSGYIDHVTEGMTATGGGELRLRLDLPLNHLDDSRVDGRYRLLANRLVFHPDLPPVADIGGELHFTEKGLDAKKLRGVMLGAPLTVDVTTAEGRVSLLASGGMTVAALRQQYAHPVLEHLAGSASWNGSIRVKKRGAELRIESSLVGLSSSLPEPFNKSATESLPLVFERKALPEPSVQDGAKAKRAAPEPAGERIQTELGLGGRLRAQLVSRQTDEGAVIERGLVAIGAPEAGLPERGVLLAVKAGQIDADFWQRMAGGNGNGNGGGDGAGGGGSRLPVDQIDLRVDELRGFNRSVHGLQLAGRKEGDAWKFDLKSREAIGRVEWVARGDEDRLVARLGRLEIPESQASPAGTATDAASDTTKHLPALDIAVDQLLWHGRDLGRLEAKAENALGIWNVQFRIANGDGEIAGTSSWLGPRLGVSGTSAMDFRLDAHSIEGLLGRLGYPNAVRRGKAVLAGQVYWDGAPTRIDYPSLGGNLNLEASRGQFRKLEPGVGRLLGVLSLQSLPRRISLDFRDIFSEGFAFESIDGKVNVARGVMRTEKFEINGPAAKVLLSGTVNVVNETQDLKVRVQPTIGESIATGVLLVNPVIGASAWLMNKVFGNPLDKAFAFDYAVTGSWADPKVEKVAVQGPTAAAQMEGAVP